VVTILAGAFGFLAAFAAHDLAAQALTDQPLRPFSGTCPNCGTQRGWLSWVCPKCDRRIGRELILAVGGTVVALGFANTVGTRWALIGYLGFLLLTLALGVTDIDSLRIVDRLNLRGTAILVVSLAITSAIDGDLVGMGRGLLAAGAYFAGTILMFLLVRGRGFGYGDVKLSVQLGLFSGFISWGTLGWSVLLTALVGGFLSIVVLLSGFLARRAKHRTEGEPGTLRDAMKLELPYGPAMILGCWLAIVMAGLGAFPIPT
jgi:Flp pilus assembly protein protease CpaA